MGPWYRHPDFQPWQVEVQTRRLMEFQQNWINIRIQGFARVPAGGTKGEGVSPVSLVSSQLLGHRQAKGTGRRHVDLLWVQIDLNNRKAYTDCENIFTDLKTNKELISKIYKLRSYTLKQQKSELKNGYSSK